MSQLHHKLRGKHLIPLKVEASRLAAGTGRGNCVAQRFCRSGTSTPRKQPQLRRTSKRLGMSYLDFSKADACMQARS